MLYAATSNYPEEINLRKQLMSLEEKLAPSDAVEDSGVSTGL